MDFNLIHAMLLCISKFLINLLVYLIVFMSCNDISHWLSAYLDCSLFAEALPVFDTGHFLAASLATLSVALLGFKADTTKYN